MENQKYIVPAIVSAILPGVGQLVKGQFVKGLLIIILGVTISAIFAWTFIIPILIWIWNVWDAYSSRSEKRFVEDKSKRADL